MTSKRNVSQHRNLLTNLILAAFAWGFLAIGIPAKAIQVNTRGPRIQLDNVVVLVDVQEASYVRYATNDLATYLRQLAARVTVGTSPTVGRGAKTIIAIGETMSHQMGVDLPASAELGPGGFLIRSLAKGDATLVIVGGRQPEATNMAVATLIQQIQVDHGSPYLDGPLNVQQKPTFSLRGIHLNGWPVNYPYAFRAWKEQDWKRFVDIAWSERVNLLFIWPFMEIVPVPLSPEDQEYLEEVHRIVDYAQKQRGMQVWIMQSANRIATSDCGSRDPRIRPYWVNECQQDMNPADPQQFSRIVKSFGALYRIVNNADAFCMIDSDPGGWPQSPLTDQLKIFQAARKLLDQYAVDGKHTKLVDWMWLGWGRHKFFTSKDTVVAAYDWTAENPDESDVAFMAKTIRNFKQNLPEPWQLIAGFAPYLRSSKMESELRNTVYLPYGAIEDEPSFPATNLGLEPVRKVLDQAVGYPDLEGIMGNNQMMLLQFPRTSYFMQSAWNYAYAKEAQDQVLHDLAGQLYPDQKDLIAECFLALRDTDPQRISAVLAQLDKFVGTGSAGRPGPIGRFLFPDQLVVARDLQSQLEIRLARESLLKALQGKPSVSECSTLMENYFDKLLAWDQKTGWSKMIDIAIWREPIFAQDKQLTESLSRLRQVLGQGQRYTTYGQIDAFFGKISKDLLHKYDAGPVMVGCVEPMKLAVIQSQ